MQRRLFESKRNKLSEACQPKNQFVRALFFFVFSINVCLLIYFYLPFFLSVSQNYPPFESKLFPIKFVPPLFLSGF